MKPSIIIIDDEPEIIDVLSEFLRMRSIDVLATGCNGKDAVELFQKHTPDIVLMDLMMSKYDGFYGLENIHKIDPNAKVIIHSGSIEQDDMARLVEMKVSAIIKKPSGLNNLVDILDKLSLGDSIEICQ